MKTKMVLLAMIAFFLVHGIGCKKELNIEFVDVSVPGKKCDMPDNYSLVYKKEFENILLFDLSEISEKEIQNRLFRKDNAIEYLIYDSSVSEDILVSYRKVSQEVNAGIYGGICNFPNDVKLWTIPATGMYVNFTAEFFYSEWRLGPSAPVYYFIALTSLKIQQL